MGAGLVDVVVGFCLGVKSGILCSSNSRVEVDGGMGHSIIVGPTQIRMVIGRRDGFVCPLWAGSALCLMGLHFVEVTFVG